jgi:hypothetical protein
MRPLNPEPERPCFTPDAKIGDLMLFTTSSVAKILGVCHSRVRQIVGQRDIGVKVGSARMILAHELRALVLERRKIIAKHRRRVASGLARTSDKR